MRFAYFLTQPILYQSPLIRHLRAGGLEEHVFYGNDATARAYFDKGFGQQLAWDVPLLVDGHLPLSEGLERGVHPLAVNERGGSSPDLDAIAAAGHQWYRPHNRENTAAAFAKLLVGA